MIITVDVTNKEVILFDEVNKEIKCEIESPKLVLGMLYELFNLMNEPDYCLKQIDEYDNIITIGKW